MEHVDLDDIDPWMGPASVKRSLSSALGAGEVSVNYYELEPGESFAFGYHRHEDQEELFYVLEGRATFETEEGTREIGSGEAVYFSPGEWQRGLNRGDGRVVALAVGAPADGGDVDIQRQCEDCGERTLQSVDLADDGEALLTACLECGGVTGRFD